MLLVNAGSHMDTSGNHLIFGVSLGFAGVGDDFP
jgi:hypothetical protein